MGLAPIQHAVGSLALDWLAREFPRFDVFRDRAATHPPEADQTAICELALTVMVLAREPAMARDRRLACLGDYLARVYQHPGFHTYVFEGHPLAFTGHLITWLAVASMGVPMPISRARMQEIAGSGRVRHANRSAFRLLELRYFLDWGAFRHTLPDVPALFAATLPAQADPPPASPSCDDVYETTHVVFYITDFGRRDPCFLDGMATKRIAGFLAGCLDLLVEVRHWDLLAEVLASLRCLGAFDKEAVARAWAVLREAQDTSGALPDSPEAARQRPPGAPLDAAEFLVLYHRGLTAALAASIGRGAEALV